MNFDTSIFNSGIEVGITGIASGFSLGFIAWGIGYAIYAIIKWFKFS